MTVVTIGLIELVAALNILITLVMMVMEKYRDIAVLMSMGARRSQIRRIFMLQGVLIGVVGTGKTSCCSTSPPTTSISKPATGSRTISRPIPSVTSSSPTTATFST